MYVNGEIYARIPEKTHQFRTYLSRRRMRVGSSLVSRECLRCPGRGERLRGGGPAERPALRGVRLRRGRCASGVRGEENHGWER